jgi:two-component system, OmpR family, sensor histidine kinase ChvG
MREGPPTPPAAPAPARSHGGVFSPLMRRILAVNMIALGILGGGILYLNQFRENLITRKIDDLRVQAEIIAGALGESASLGPESQNIDFNTARQVIDRLVGPTRTRARLFAPGGALVLDSLFLDPSRAILVVPLPPPDEEAPWNERALAAFNRFLDSLTMGPRLSPYVERPRQQATDYPEAVGALMGETRTQIRSTGEGAAVITAAAPVQRFRRVLGVLMLSTDTAEIQDIIQEERLTILKVFGISLAVTLLLSLFLGGTIARPIRRLSAAADEVRRGIGRPGAFARYAGRRDEVGTLSRSLADMTAALHRQIDAVERFAADVAHELKNPLSSLRSAVETIEATQDPKVREKMAAIVQADIRRLDRLISDISDASRLDAELSRAHMEKVDFGALVAGIVSGYRANEGGRKAEIVFAAPKPGAFTVKGIESRLGQVVYNLLDNALSFTPAGKSITLTLARKKGMLEFAVEDEGPGLPDGAEEKIFNRFYSERPKKEAFGTHSGLGLSIARQIVEAHGGTIRAENRLESAPKAKGRKRGAEPKVAGARFIVRLPA